MKYSREQLMELPMNILRGIDILSKEEENLVQDVLNTRMADAPAPARILNIPSHLTDKISSKEDELKLQNLVDKKREEMKHDLVTDSDVVEEPIVEVLEPVDAPSEVPGGAIPGDDVVAPPIDPEAPVEVKFCDFCDSKGVRHKKVCIRPTQ